MASPALHRTLPHPHQHPSPTSWVPGNMASRENCSVPGPPIHVPTVQQVEMLLQRGGCDKNRVTGVKYGPGSFRMLSIPRSPHTVMERLTSSL